MFESGPSAYAAVNCLGSCTHNLGSLQGLGATSEC